jgi:uncharacterized protein
VRIGVLSDTHMSGPSRGFLAELRQSFAGVHRVLHCGDCVRLSVLDMLQEEGWEVTGVAGNMDDAAVRESLPVARTIRFENTTIGLVHGWGSHQGLEGRVAGAFDGVDGVIYGHSHRPHWGRVGGMWLFNPGAACGWGSPKGPTVGILEIGEQVKGTIISLKVGAV